VSSSCSKVFNLTVGSFPMCNSPVEPDSVLRPAIKDYDTIPFVACTSCVWDGIFRDKISTGCIYESTTLVGCTVSEWDIRDPRLAPPCLFFAIQLEQFPPIGLKWAGRKAYAGLPASLLGVYTRAPALSSTCTDGSSDCSPGVASLEIIAVVPPP